MEITTDENISNSAEEIEGMLRDTDLVELSIKDYE
jgi:hypothetical protein